MESPNKFLIEGIKKNQIEEVFNNQDFKVGIEYEFYNTKFLDDTNRPDANETLLLGLFTDVLNGAKKKNRNILNNNRNQTKKNKIINSYDILDDFEAKDAKVLLQFFKRNEINLSELIDLIYFYIASPGSKFPKLFKEYDYKKDVFDKYTGPGKFRKFQKFMSLLNSKVSGEVPFREIKKFYTKEGNLPPSIKNPLVSVSAKASKDRWGITVDPSISPAIGGIEFISPPMKPKEAIIATDQIFRYIKQNGNTESFYDEMEITNPRMEEPSYRGSNKRESQCGLHINISFKPERMKNFDPLKFLIFSHESQVDQKKLFGDRKDAAHITKVLPELKTYFLKISKNVDLGSEKTDEQREATFHEYTKNKMSKGLNLLKSIMNSGLVADKYSNFNLANFKHTNRSIRRASSERIEIRYFGGQGYEDKFMLFRKVLGELLYALDIATDPEKEKKTYYKKAYKILNLIRTENKKK